MDFIVKLKDQCIADYNVKIQDRILLDYFIAYI